MSRAKSIKRHLPFLRRYAQGLTGSQSAGDAYVQATLDAVLNPDCAAAKAVPSIELYRCIHVIWPDTGEIVVPESSPAASAREALLLTAAGLGSAEAARILGKTQDSVDSEIASAQVKPVQKLASLMLVIGDESTLALHRASLLIESGQNVVAVAATRLQAVRQARTRSPAIVLASVQQAQCCSQAGVAPKILGSFDVSVVFIATGSHHISGASSQNPPPDYNKPAIGQALLFQSGA